MSGRAVVTGMCCSSTLAAPMLVFVFPVRALPLAVLTVLTVAAAAAGLRTPPPGLSDQAVAIAAAFQYQVEPLEDETDERLDDARALAERHGPSAAQPDRVVLGVGVARVLSTGDSRPEQRVDGTFWVVIVDNVRSECFGTSCGPSRPDALEVVIADLDSLEEQEVVVGGTG